MARQAQRVMQGVQRPRDIDLSAYGQKRKKLRERQNSFTQQPVQQQPWVQQPLQQPRPVQQPVQQSSPAVQLS